MGGEAALGQLRTIAVRGQDSQWEHESSYEPGPKAKSRPAGEAKFVVRRDLVSGNARIDWDRTVLRTPKPLPLKYSEIVAGGIGYVSGIDSAARTQASLGSDPPGHPMSGARTTVDPARAHAPVAAAPARHEEQCQVDEAHRRPDRRRQDAAGHGVQRAGVDLRGHVRSGHAASRPHPDA